MCRRCSTFVLMHMHSYIHSWTSNLYGTMCDCPLGLKLWSVPKGSGVASSCFSMFKSSLGRIWEIQQLQVEAQESGETSFGLSKLLFGCVWFRWTHFKCQQPWTEWLWSSRPVAGCFEVRSCCQGPGSVQHPCFRRHFSNSLGIWVWMQRTQIHGLIIRPKYRWFDIWTTF